MYEFKTSTATTNAGNNYDIPVNMNAEDFYKLMYEFVDLAKVKGLTVRQAQYLFETCADYVLESKLN